MAQRVPWNIDEAVILLDALLAVHEGRITRKEGIASVSSELRARAENTGVEVDAIFRNINGITMQMATMEYILTDGKRGLKKSSMPKLFQDAVDLYRNNRIAYEKILKGTRIMPEIKSVQDQYFSWLASQVSPAQLSDWYVLYADIENFCLERKIITKKLFELTSLFDIDNVVKTVESNRIFRFTYRRNLSKMSSAIRSYYQFMKERPELLAHSASAQQEVKKEELSAVVPETNLTATETDVDQIVDFTANMSLAFTQPTKFSYFHEHHAEVSSWAQLYVQVVACLLEDYPDTLYAYINRSIGGQTRYDFADEIGAGSMKAPKKVKDNFYLEANINATDILRKIKRLLDLCNVDYENLTIHYRRKEPNAATPALQAEAGKAEISEIRVQFIEWMKQEGTTVSTTFNYLSAIGQASKAAKEYGICDTELLLVPDANKLDEIKTLLLNIPAFQEHNARQHNRFRAAITKLIAFRSATASQNIEKPEIHTPVVKTDGLDEKPSVLLEERRSRYAEILTEYFGESGYQPGRPIFRGRFRRYYVEKYGCDPDEMDDGIDGMMATVGTVRDGRIFPKQDESQNNLLADITADILSAFETGATAIYVEAIFHKYRQALADNLQIYNQDALTPLLMTYAKGRYTQRYSYLTRNPAGADSAADLLQIMKTFHQPQNYEAIHEKAWFIPYDRMKNLLVSEKSIVNVAPETYFYAPNLPVSTEELMQLTDCIHEELNCYSHITDAKLRRLIAEKCPSIAINTEEYTTYGLRNCLGYLLRDQFAFTGPIITLKDQALSISDCYREFSRDHEALQIEELADFSAEMNTPIYWDSVFSEMIRVSATELVRKDLIDFDVETIDTVLEGMCSEEYAPLKDVSLFLSFPNIGYPWNSYLLESYLFSCSRKFRLLHLSFSKTGTFGAMVRAGSDIQDYRSLLADVLSRSNALHSTNAALQYIVDAGYQQRKKFEGIERLMQEAKLIKEQREKK